MSSENRARWVGQFVLYLVLFALLISAGAYFWWGNGESTQPRPVVAQPEASPSIMPAGQSGHETQSPK